MIFPKRPLPSYVGSLYGLTQDEHKELLESVKPFSESVVRIIRIEEGELDSTGSAFLVYSGDSKSLYLTCDHNFGEVTGEASIRLYNGEEDKNYPVAEILRQSDKHDLLNVNVWSSLLIK